MLDKMEKIEQAILKTLIYSDLFDYPLTKVEIEKYLIEVKATQKDLQTSLEFLLEKKKIIVHKGFCCLMGKEPLIELRQKRAEISRKKMSIAQKWLPLLKCNPWLKMVAVTGALSMENAEEGDDIDLMLIFTKDRLFLGRLLEFFLLKLIGRRRQPGQKEVKDVFCPNLYLTEDSLEIKNKDLFTAHEIVQVKVIWEREDIYKRFLLANQWVGKFLPNYLHYSSVKPACRRGRYQASKGTGNRIFDWLERTARKIQLKHMEEKISIEKIGEKALFFHPQDVRETVLQRYEEKVAELLRKEKEGEK